MADPVDALAGQLAGMGIADPPAAVRAADAAVVAFVPQGAAARRQSFADKLGAAAAGAEAKAAEAARLAEASAAETAAAAGRALDKAKGFAGDAVGIARGVWGFISSASSAVAGAATVGVARTAAAVLQAPGHAVKLVVKIAAGGGTMVFAGAVIADLARGGGSGILMYANECVAQIAGSAEDPDVRAWVLAVLIHEMATKGVVSTKLLTNLKDLFTPEASGGRRRKRRGGSEEDDLEECFAKAIAVGMIVKGKELETLKGSAEPSGDKGTTTPTSTPPRGGRRTRRHRRHRPSAPTRKARRTSYGGRKHYTRPRRG